MNLLALCGFEQEYLDGVSEKDLTLFKLANLWSWADAAAASASAAYLFWISTRNLIPALLAFVVVAMSFVAIQYLLNASRGSQLSAKHVLNDGLRINQINVFIYLALTIVFTQPALIAIERFLLKEQQASLNRREKDVRIEQLEIVNDSRKSEIQRFISRYQEKTNQLMSASGESLAQSQTPDDENFVSKRSIGNTVRRALVIGAQSYRGAALDKPIQDAQDIAKVLKSSGYDVTLIKDPDLAAFQFAITNYVKSIRPGDISLFYYSGHGAQDSGVNYLLPVDFSIPKQHTPAELSGSMRQVAVSVNTVLHQINSKNPLASILITDACRSTLTDVDEKGLSKIEPGPNTFIAMSASPGQTSLEGGGLKNSFYTAALLKHIKESRDISKVFNTVRADVQDSTHNQQNPIETSTLTFTSDFIIASSATKVSKKVSDQINIKEKPSAQKDWDDCLSAPLDVDKNSPQFNKAIRACQLKYWRAVDDLNDENDRALASVNKLRAELDDRFSDEKFNPTLFYRFIWSESVFIPILISLLLWGLMAGGMVMLETMTATLALYRHNRNTADANWLTNHHEQLKRRLDFHHKRYLDAASRLDEGPFMKYIDKELLKPVLPDLFPFDAIKEDLRKQVVTVQAKQAFDNVMNHLSRQG